VGNVGTKIAMRVGATDAEFLAKQFAPVFTAHDLNNSSKPKENDLASSNFFITTS
jgi:hypothetical protein